MVKFQTLFSSFIFCWLLQSHISFGQQFYNSDPYRINFTNLDIEYTRSEVVKYKIKSASSKEYEIKRSKLGNQIPKSNFYKVEFNEAGNPVKYQSKSYRATHDPKDEISKTFNYLFEYDILENLIHIRENEIHFSSPGNYYENDIYFFYDNSNVLTEQIVSKKHIYDSGFQYEGLEMRNDTTLNKFIFNYDAYKKVTSVFKVTYESYSKKRWSDTLKFNCSFDSIFIEKSISKGMKKDREGRIIENVRYAKHVLLRGGGCISPESPDDLVTNFYYDKNGKLIKSVSRSRNGDFIRTKYWTYNEKGLLESIQIDKSKQITIYEYGFY